MRGHDALMLFDPGSTHNFISMELAAKLGIQAHDMGDELKANGFSPKASPLRPCGLDHVHRNILYLGRFHEGFPSKCRIELLDEG